MEFGGRYHFAAERRAVWAALNDAALLKAIIPGCERIEWSSPTTLELKVRVAFGPVRPAFSGELSLSDIDPAVRYTLSGRGKGMVGFAQAAADIGLTDAEDGGTVLSFAADGHADGGIMRLGRALVGNSAQQIIDGFFAAIGAQMGTIVIALPPAQI